MNRRVFIRLVGGVAAWPLVALSQSPEKQWRIGLLETTELGNNQKNLMALTEALRDLGYVQGSNLVLDYRSAQGQAERFEELAAELVRLNVDVIVARGTPATLAAKNASSTIPVVTTASAQPFTFVGSLARPGGNVTGLSSLVSELYAKRVELIKEAVPSLTRLGTLFNRTNPNYSSNKGEVDKAARSLGVEVRNFDLQTGSDIPTAFEAALNDKIQAMIVGIDTVTQSSAALVIQLAAEHRLPAIYAAREFFEIGGLMAYGVNYPDLYRRAATLVDKIFKGARPSDLPIEQPTKFELLLNLKTAKALGIEVPPTLLARADEVIE